MTDHPSILDECEICHKMKPKDEGQVVQLEAASWGYYGGCPADYGFVCNDCNESWDDNYGDDNSDD